MMDLQKFSNDRTISIVGAGLFDANPEITHKAIPLIGVRAGAVDLAMGADRAPGGVADYAARLGPLYKRIAASRQHEQPWDEALIKVVQAQRGNHLGHAELESRRAWRDEQCMTFAAA